MVCSCRVVKPRNVRKKLVCRMRVSMCQGYSMLDPVNISNVPAEVMQVMCRCTTAHTAARWHSTPARR